LKKIKKNEDEVFLDMGRGWTRKYKWKDVSLRRNQTYQGKERRRKKVNLKRKTQPDGSPRRRKGRAGKGGAEGVKKDVERGKRRRT